MGPTNYKEQIRDLKSRLASEPDRLYRELLEQKIKDLYKLASRESVEILLQRQAENRSRWNTNRAPIKCGLRNATGGQVAEKPDHWYWDSASEKDAKELERIKNTIRKKLFFKPEKTLVRKFHILGGFSKALKALKLEALTQLPEETRKAKGEVILKLIEKELNGDAKGLPFC